MIKKHPKNKYTYPDKRRRGLNTVLIGEIGGHIDDVYKKTTTEKFECFEKVFSKKLASFRYFLKPRRRERRVDW